MRKARSKGQGSGRAADGARRGRGSGRGETVPASRAGETKSPQIPSFMSQFAGRRKTPLSKPQQCEQVVGWMAADNASSRLSTTLSSTKSSLSSQESGQRNPHPDPPSSHHVESAQTSDPTLGFSEELFSSPFLHLGLSSSPLQEGHEEMLCPDSQTLEHTQSEEDDGGERQLVSHVVDDDETQLPICQRKLVSQQVDDEDETQLSEVIVRSTCEEEAQSEEVEDDEIADPTWQGGKPSQDSSTEGEESLAPQQTGRGRGVAKGRRQATPSRPTTVPRSTPLRKSPLPKGRCSAVWAFFEESADDKRIVICNLCSTKMSRGVNTSNLTTTSMIRHMAAKHHNSWAERLGPQSLSAGHTTASSSHMLCAGQSPVQDAVQDASRSAPGPSKAPSASSSTSVSQRGVQMSLPQAFERKRKYPSTHPQAVALNAQLSKLLALEMLPFRLVDTEAFRSLMAAAVPRYAVPSRHYFSRCAVPALHQHVSQNITRALTNAVTGKVHLTTDTWTSAFGQGRYISLTAHWVNVVEDGSELYPGMSQVLPTPRIAGPTSIRISTTTFSSGCNPSLSSATYSSTSTSQLSSCSTSQTSVSSWKQCSTAVGKRQQAVLKLICLGDKQHTAAELWQGIRDQTDLWLSPLNLQPGMVVSDNGRNLVAALKVGKLTHVPCLAHVFNLIVQRFLKTYPNLPELLVKVRRMCAHFRKSSTASAGLATLQQRLNLPAHRLLCDLTTRWNSTFHMLARLCEQQRAVVEYQLQHGRRLSTQLPLFTSDEWAWMSELCEVLRNFDESTQMVSGESAIISVTIPLLCLLKRSLLTIKANSLLVEEVEMGEDTTLGDSQSTLGSSSQRHFEEEEEEEEQEQETVAPATEDSTDSRFTPSLQRGWAEEEEEDEEDESHPPGEESEALSVGTQAHMADFMLCCLSRDPRVIRILDNTDYWLFTLLDPRYKENFSSLIPVGERATKMVQYQKALVEKLLLTFPAANAGGRVQSSFEGGETRGTHSSSNKGRATLSKAWDSFMTQRQHTHPAERPNVSRREKFWKMVKEYLADRVNVLSDHSVPYNYWVSKVDTWHELSLYALEVLACPAASVLSERVFSAAGGIITDKRIRLSTENADRLTLIKMNKAWIAPDFATPPQESG